MKSPEAVPGCCFGGEKSLHSLAFVSNSFLCSFESRSKFGWGKRELFHGNLRVEPVFMLPLSFSASIQSPR